MRLAPGAFFKLPKRRENLVDGLLIQPARMAEERLILVLQAFVLGINLFHFRPFFMLDCRNWQGILKLSQTRLGCHPLVSRAGQAGVAAHLRFQRQISAHANCAIK